METHAARQTGPKADLRIRLLGPLAIIRGEQPLSLPASRKVRALLAYLALAAHPVARSQLCDLLWDLPNDPRAELRWCLSKIRSLIDEPERDRVVAQGDAISLDLSDCFVDAVEIIRAEQGGWKGLTPGQLRALSDLFVGDFAEGLEVDHSPLFDGWVAAQRRKFRDLQTSLLEHAVRRFPDKDARHYLDRWIELAPFDLGPHELLLKILFAQGRVREGEEHFSATMKLFESESLDSAPLRELWRKTRHNDEKPTQVPATPATAPETPRVAANDFVEPRRATVAVMPFTDMSASAIPGGPADALVHDIITRLAKLRSLRIIAQGTMFALRDQHVTPEEAGRMLGVDYIVSGSLQHRGNRVVARIELAEARSAQIVWADVLDHNADDTFLLLDEIGNRIVASIDREIETTERNRAILKPPNTLDAWEAHHRGLWHMYRFTKADNDQARHFFEIATRFDPTFARAYAGLSFTHWQSAFQGWSEKAPSTEQAYAAASQSLMADDRDPAAHWAMGRALWLRDNHAQSIGELEKAVELSPNFALGHYSLAFVHSQTGDPNAAIISADYSRDLSPFDPLLFGMLASRALALVRLNRFEEAADWSVKAAIRPNAHVHILAIAALCLTLVDRLDEARAYLGAIRSRFPRYSLSDFFAAFHIMPQVEALLRKGAKQIGLEN